ncbi:phospholipid/cholesterol/gamma-HCH transport system substrate-binding protein [Mycolicibacterium sp. 624]
MTMDQHDDGLHPAWWTLILVVLLGVAFWLTYSLFLGTFKATETVTLTSDRSGLVMETNARVKLRGVQVGRVASIQGGSEPVALKLEIDKDKIKYIPANVEAQIRATTVFGAKFVDLVYPSDPSPQRLAPGQVIESRNVTVEANTVFQNVVAVLEKIDAAKLNSTLSALADGVRGQGERIGQATTDANTVLLELNPRYETITADLRALRDFNDTFGVAAQNILSTLDALSTTSTTITSGAQQLDALLLATIGLSNSGISLLAPNQANLIRAINVLEPTTNLLYKYSPEYTCLLVGAKTLLDTGGYEAPGGNGRTLVLDVGLALGDDPYHYPNNLPVIGAKGGPGGKPGCGSLPDVAQNWPVRNLVTNTGFGTGMDWRPNPGIGFPAWANYFPTTRGVPEPPSIRNLFGGPAPGPIPYPGAPAYGADLYAPDGTPLWPGLPPPPPPMAPKDPGPRPGTEPFIVHSPAEMQPTPLPPIPLPHEAVPSP